MTSLAPFPPIALRVTAAAALAIACLTPAQAQTPDQQIEGTRLLRTPSVSASHVAFAYANNIWVVAREGGAARRRFGIEYGKVIHGYIRKNYEIVEHLDGTTLYQRKVSP